MRSASVFLPSPKPVLALPDWFPERENACGNASFTALVLHPSWFLIGQPLLRRPVSLRATAAHRSSASRCQFSSGFTCEQPCEQHRSCIVVMMTPVVEIYFRCQGACFTCPQFETLITYTFPTQICLASFTLISRVIWSRFQ